MSLTGLNTIKNFQKYINDLKTVVALNGNYFSFIHHVKIQVIECYYESWSNSELGFYHISEGIGWIKDK